LTVLLLTWNSLAARYANPLTLVKGQDGAQYQLLARNRIQGNTEVGDSAYTVRGEGRHPMWRPGLVWVEEGFGRLLGSVRAGAAVASGLGTALLELALLWLAYLCFSRQVVFLLVVGLLTPLTISVSLMRMAVFQGPEPWAAAALVTGLGLLVIALRRRSWPWALAAGAVAGLAEWFRTGNLLLFLLPCGVYAVAGWWQRNRRQAGFTAAALASYLLMAGLGGLTTPSPVNKTVANLWHNWLEQQGPLVTELVPEFQCYSVGGCRLAPGGTETCYDYSVRRSREISTAAFVGALGDSLVPVYFERLGRVFTHTAWGLRQVVGGAVLVLFLLQLLLAAVFRRGDDVHTLAFGAGVLAHYLGPLALLVGEYESHYFFVLLPFIALGAARGVMRLAELASWPLRSWAPIKWDWLRRRAWCLPPLIAAPAVTLGVGFFPDVLEQLHRCSWDARCEQEALDRLGLEGHKVACSNMAWFVDRNVQTVLLPYAAVKELERYARANALDGVLVWEHEPLLLFRASPYGSLLAWEQAMRASSLFGPPRVSGPWRWYRVRRPDSPKAQP
jgi:hypothetical protein